jgi:lipopolysaccharide biosynthesis glycosyltransferase
LGGGGGNFFLKETFNTISLLTYGTTVTEQDMFNKLLTDRILYLPLKYNLYVNNIINNFERHYYPFFFPRAVIEEAFSNPVIIHYTLPEKPWIYSNAKAVYASFYKFTTALWQNYYLKSPTSKKKLKKKRVGLFKILWYHLKPFLKQNRVLLKIKRHIAKTKANSPIYDFFD